MGPKIAERLSDGIMLYLSETIARVEPQT